MFALCFQYHLIYNVLNVKNNGTIVRKNILEFFMGSKNTQGLESIR